MFVPEEYMQTLLTDMPNAFINSARKKKHLRPPVWREASKVFHYRDYEINDIYAALSQHSTVPLALKKSYLGDQELSERSIPQSAREALEAAKERARRRTIQYPTVKLEIVVGRGEGRATREFEMIWWSELFSATAHDKLTLRFYVSKVSL